MRSCVWWGQWLCNVAKVANKSQCTGYLPKTNKQTLSWSTTNTESQIQIQRGWLLCNATEVAGLCALGAAKVAAWGARDATTFLSSSTLLLLLLLLFLLFLIPRFLLDHLLFVVYFIWSVIDDVSPGGDTQASVNSATETVPSLVFWKPFALTSTHHAMTPRKL